MLKTYEEYQKQIRENGNASMFARDSYSEQVVPVPKSTLSYDPVQSKHAFNPNLDTPEGLYKLASSLGMKEGADRAVEKAGGESQRFFSGGWFMDIMDVLNIGSYGVVGMVKGKGFIEGVKNRETLSDDDALGKYGWQGKIAGFIGDIVLDPLTYIAPVKIVSKIPGFAKGAEMAKNKLVGELTSIGVDGQSIAKRTGGWSPVKLLGSKLVYGFAVDKKFLEAEQQIIGRTEAMAGDADNLVGIFSKMDPELMKKTLSKDETGRFISTPLEALQRELSPEQMENVSQMYKMRDGAMDRLTELGVISKETRDSHWETYLKQSYDEYMDAKKTVSGKAGIGIQNKARVEELTPEKMKELGQVEDPAIIWGTTLLKQVDLLRKAELQDMVSKNFSLTTEQLAKYGDEGGLVSDLVRVSDDAKRYGPLAGKYVQKDSWDMLKGTFEPTKELGENLVLKFKHLKVIWNPASHARNAVSAGIQNWWRMGIGPWRVDIYNDAMRELSTLKKPIGQQGKHITMMKELGFNERSGQIAELTENYLNKRLLGDVVGKQTGKTKSQVSKFFKSADNLFLKTYGHMDNVAKVAAFKYGLKKGMSPEDALKAAYEATFNYSQVTPLVHRMRRAIWGVPFITFALKATPLVGRTVANAPGRISVFGKARNDLFKAAGVEGEQEAEALPDYMRDDMFVMRLPWKDEKGRSMYFDMSYIIPFGAVVTGEYLKNPLAANPVLQTVKELSQNKTFSGSKIFNESDDIDTVIADVFFHVIKIGMPPALANQLPDGYNFEGKREFRSLLGGAMKEDTQDLGPGERSHYQEMAKLAGFGVSPYDLESKERQMAYKQKEKLTQLMVENDILKEFRSPYLPKDSELQPSPLLKNLYEGKDTFTR